MKYVQYRLQLSKFYSDNNLNKDHHSLHREKIPWYPTIDNEKCVNCGVCIEYCRLGVFDVGKKEEKKPLVKNPFNCVVLCTGCEGQCPVGAITFPFKQKIRKLITELQKNGN